MDNNKTGNAESKAVVTQSEDAKTDQDFPGFPHAHAQEKIIKPETESQKKTAAVNIKDGEKDDEQNSDGSGGAFEATEAVGDDD